MTSYLYSWRYQVPTDVADAQPAQLEREARKAAVRDARHDGWTPAAEPLFNAYEAHGLDNVTDLVVTFAVNAKDTTGCPQEFHKAEQYLPAGPLVELVNGREIRKTFTEAQWRAFYRGRKSGWFTLDAADKLAVALGHTLETVWPPQVLSRPLSTLATATEGDV